MPRRSFVLSTKSLLPTPVKSGTAFNPLGLMPKYVDELFKTIGSLHQEGVTTLLVEQNARKALAVADRGYVLETGKILLKDEARKLAADPRVKKAYLGG